MSASAALLFAPELLSGFCFSSCPDSMLEDGIIITSEEESLTVPLLTLLLLLSIFSAFPFVVLVVLFFFLGMFLGLVSLLFFSSVVDFLEEAIVF